MKIFIIILFFLFTSHSEDFSSDSLIKRVESKYNRFAKNRFIALNELLKKLEKKISQLNLKKLMIFLIMLDMVMIKRFMELMIIGQLLMNS